MRKLILLVLIITCIYCAQLKSNTQVTMESNEPVDVLVGEIQKIKTFNRNEQNDHDANHQNNQQKCSEELALRQAEIDDATERLSQATTKLSECQNDKVLAEQSLEQQEKILQELKDQKQQAIELREKQHKIYVERYNIIQDTLNNIDQAYEILEQFQNSQTESGSFIQLTKHTNKLFKSSIKSGSSSLLVELLTTLVQIKESQEYTTEDNTILTADAVQKIRSLLNSLEERLQKDQETLTNVEQQEVKDHQQFIQTTDERIAQTEDFILAIKDQINNLNICIADQNVIIQEQTERKVNNEKVYFSTKQLCEEEQASYEEITKLRNEKLALLIKLEAYIEESDKEFNQMLSEDPNSDTFKEFQTQFQAEMIQAPKVQEKTNLRKKN